MGMIAYLVNMAFNVYIFVIIAQVAINWLIIFDVVNVNNPQARNLMDLLKRLTDPVYKPIRKYVPAIGGIDITPIIVILGVSILQRIVMGALYSI